MTHIYTLADLLIGTQTVWAEARGETQQGREWVAHVLVNRLESKTGQWAKDDTLATVCLRHLQFSAWTESDPNFAKMQDGPDLNDYAWRSCMMAVLKAINRRPDKDLTGGAKHYHALSVNPLWARGNTDYDDVGRHRFHRGIA